jgi:hypothetical protein
MSRQDLSHLTIGQTVALRIRDSRSLPGRPRLAHRLLVITKETATTFEAQHSGRTIKVRKKDGKVLGQDYEYIIEATPEIIDDYHATAALITRDQAAQHACADLIDRPLHQLKLSTEQLEALAKAWTEIKAMATTTSTTTTS